MYQEYEKLTFTNNFMFCKIMQSNPDLCKDIAETILDVKIKEIVRIDKESVIEITEDGRGIRFDVYFEDSAETIYDIEMQTVDTGSLPKRSRYYQGMIDLSTLDRGDDYNELRKTYIVFICTFDPFGQNLAKYTFMNTCEEDSTIKLNDDSVKVFVNASEIVEDTSSNMRDFLSYITSGNPSGDLSLRIDSAVKDARKNKEWRMNYMTFEWELASARRIAKEEGRAEGRAEGQLEIIQSILDHVSPEEAAKMGVPVDLINKVLNA